MHRFRLSGAVIAFVAGLAAASPALAIMGTNAEHAILIDGKTGQVLWAKNAYVPTPPASMSKLMTIDLLFQRLKDGRVKLTDTFPVSQRAWATQGSKMFVMVGNRIPVEDLIRGIIIQSGNDACVVVAEALGGTVENFVTMMNARAKELGLSQSHFVNPNGLPDPPGQMMSVADLAKLARDIQVSYPQFYHYFGERSFAWQNINQPNRNTVLEKLPGADGLKTGYTDASGYGIVASAERNGERLILVLNGLRYPDLDQDSSVKRDWIAEQRRGDEAARILGMAFREFRRYPLFKAHDVVGQANVRGGAEKTVPLTVIASVAPMLQVDSRAGLKVRINYKGPLQAPVAQGQKIGTLTVTAPDYPGLTVPVYAAKAVPQLGIFGRMMEGLSAMIFGKQG